MNDKDERNQAAGDLDHTMNELEWILGKSGVFFECI